MIYKMNPVNHANLVNPASQLRSTRDLLWSHDQGKSLAAFMEAFDFAVQNFKENGDQIQRTSDSRFAAVISVPDQRFTVISALAKRDRQDLGVEHSRCAC